jgi:hypothetical protein
MQRSATTDCQTSWFDFHWQYLHATISLFGKYSRGAGGQGGRGEGSLLCLKEQQSQIILSQHVADLGGVGKKVLSLVHVGRDAPAVEMHGSQMEPGLPMSLQYSEELRSTPMLMSLRTKTRLSKSMITKAD